MVSEFDLIRQLAAKQVVRRKEVVQGIGDDAAILGIPDGHELLVSTDTLNIGVHFPEDTSARDIGYKALAVNLSDMAAMGAKPLAVNLSLSLPRPDHAWVSDFADGFFEQASTYHVQLMGGDTTRGPLSIGVTIMGTVKSGCAIRRSGAQPGDLIYVTGTVGDAGAALSVLRGELNVTQSQRHVLLGRLNRPSARVDIGLAIQGHASACIDISDGLTADLGHILEQSDVGATLHVAQIPLSTELKDCLEATGGWAVPLYSGDDYELCFTVPAAKQGGLETVLSDYGYSATCVGRVEAGEGLKLLMPDGGTEVIMPKGYDHFM